MEQPTKSQLVINLESAKLGLTILNPSSPMGVGSSSHRSTPPNIAQYRAFRSGRDSTTSFKVRSTYEPFTA